jgi:hypothetical protein
VDSLWACSAILAISFPHSKRGYEESLRILKYERLATVYSVIAKHPYCGGASF